MKKGYLSQYFKGVATKLLSHVEIGVSTSNQHEFNGVKELQNILGEPTNKQRYPTKFIYLTDQDDQYITDDGFLTWYDARKKARIEHNVMRWEYRLYFPTNLVLQLANAGDILVIAKQTDDTLLVIVAAAGTTIAQQVLWLFGFSDSLYPRFSVRNELESNQDKIEFASRFILDSIGIFVESTQDIFLDEMLEKFDGKFPTTREFSAYARSTLPDVNIQDGHDETLMAWMEREEMLFRTLEKYLLSERLSLGFDNDVDGFISLSLSVQNRRKCRAGLAFENHLEVLFEESKVKYSRTPITENKSKPDFIFPGQDEYLDLNFNTLNLTMLGVKSSCKDRWRQVLVEADRINNKHLLTLEASISQNQTNEMMANNLQLVIPNEIQKTYAIDQQKWLISVADFVDLVLDKQSY